MRGFWPIFKRELFLLFVTPIAWVLITAFLVMQGLRSDGGAVFTFTNWSGHPEVWGGDNMAISSDWPGVARDLIEARFGGIAIHMPEALGGMQSALNGDVPLVDQDGPVEGMWAEHNTREFVFSLGWHIAEARYARLNTSPSEASRSMFGVAAFCPP